MRLSHAWLAPLICCALACAPDPKIVPATEVVARIDGSASVIADTAWLHVRTAAQGKGGWVDVDEKKFAQSDLRWPVDIVLTPRSEAEAGSYFELVVDALDAAGSVLVQARALSAFVSREARVLPLSLASCGSNTLGFVCETQANCHGAECLTCVGTSCAGTPMVAPDALPSLFDASSPPSDANATAPGAAPTDAGLGGHDAASLGPDAATSSPDAATSSPDAASPDAASPDADTGPVSCPSGYSLAPTGCSDDNECTNGTAKCDAQAVCKNTPGSYTCGSCPTGFSGGADGNCVDIKECATNNGGCSTSPMATCNEVVGGPNTCSCPAFYMGQGRGAGGCLDILECSANNGDCSAQATCAEQVGAAPKCTCASGYSGLGTGLNGCTNDNDCAPNPCQNGGTCADGINAYTCSCGAAFTGKNCELQICGDVTVRSQADVDNARLCAEIHGNLSLVCGIAEIKASDFPYLTKVTGDVSVSASGAATLPSLLKVTLGALQTIGDGLFIQDHHATSTAQVVTLPALTVIGTPGSTSNALEVAETSLGRLELPALTTINGNVLMDLDSVFCFANLKSVTNVTGTVTVYDFYYVPFSSLRPLSTSAKGTVTISGVGCCTGGDLSNCPSQYSCTPITCP